MSGYAHLGRLLGDSAVHEVVGAKRDLSWQTHNACTLLDYIIEDSVLLATPENDPFSDPDPYGPWAVWPGRHPEYDR